MPKKQLIRQIPREKFRKGADGKAARKGRDLLPLSERELRKEKEDDDRFGKLLDMNVYLQGAQKEAKQINDRNDFVGYYEDPSDLERIDELQDDIDEYKKKVREAELIDHQIQRQREALDSIARRKTRGTEKRERVQFYKKKIQDEKKKKADDEKKKAEQKIKDDEDQRLYLLKEKQKEDEMRDAEERYEKIMKLPASVRLKNAVKYYDVPVLPQSIFGGGTGGGEKEVSYQGNKYDMIFDEEFGIDILIEGGGYGGEILFVVNPSI